MSSTGRAAAQGTRSPKTASHSSAVFCREGRADRRNDHRGFWLRLRTVS